MEASHTGATGQAQEKAQQVAGQAQEKVQEAAGQAKGQLRTQVDQRSTQAGEQITSQASDIRTVAQQLREQGKDQPAKIADQAADRVERVGSYLSDASPDRLLHDLEDFGRRQPWAIALGGLALGFAASRVLKASSQERYETRSGGGYGYRSSGAVQPRAQIPQHTSAPTAHPTTPPVSPAPTVTDPVGGVEPADGRFERPGVPTGGGIA
jgi:gas vesicle protein